MRRAFMRPVVGACLVGMASASVVMADDASRKAEYVEAVVRGAGYLPWQAHGPSDAETEFRASIEQRKDEMIAARMSVEHPVLLSSDEIVELRRKVKAEPSAVRWLANMKTIADYVASQPEDYVTKMISSLTPTHPYGWTCPRCVGKQSQEAVGAAGYTWNYREPDVLRCKACGLELPNEAYPETAKLVCPRMDQTFTYYLNEQERAHPDDHSGRLAYHWVGHPVHMSYSGMIRQEKVIFMLHAAHHLAMVYAITEQPQYAERAIAILERFAETYRHWLYHDYWDTIADCEPMYAAWHWSALPLEYKRHLCADAYAKDTVESASMLQSYWGAGRIHPSTDIIWYLQEASFAYDLVHDAKDEQGRSLWTAERRAKVERDFLMEYLMGAEPFLGGRGKADNVTNKSPRVYGSMAAVARVLGMAEWADTALRGYEGIRDRSFFYDGFSRESPAYNNAYLGSEMWITERLHGFRWPANFPGRQGTVDLYASDPFVRRMWRAVLDVVQADGRYLPLSDTNAYSRPSDDVIELGVQRFPDLYRGTSPTLHGGRGPGEYALLHLTREQWQYDTGLTLHEVFFPCFMVATLRHGTGPDAAVLTLSDSPAGNHRHRDNLAVYYEDRGRRILGDHGYVGDMPLNDWIRSTRSHNLVVVDAGEQQFNERAPRLEMMVTSPKVSVVEASSTAYPQCRVYRRLVALVKGPTSQTFAVDVFRVRGGKRHDYRLFSELASSDATDGALLFDGLSMPPEPPLPQIGGSLAHADIFGLRDVRRVDDPPASFQAAWREGDDVLRTWVLTAADRVEASNGPGQETRTDAGRRVRYLDVIREGDADLASTFVAVHEPSGRDGAMVIRSAERLGVPERAGPDAVAVRIDSMWGTYLVLSDFAQDATVDGVRFAGQFGVYCRSSSDGQWLLASGASTLRAGDFGFVDKTSRWSGAAHLESESVIIAGSPRPGDWPAPIDGVRGYVLLNDGQFDTGFPVERTVEQRIEVTRFPIPQAKRFDLPAVRMMRDAETP